MLLTSLTDLSHTLNLITLAGARFAHQHPDLQSIHAKMERFAEKAPILQHLKTLLAELIEQPADNNVPVLINLQAALNSVIHALATTTPKTELTELNGPRFRITQQIGHNDLSTYAWLHAPVKKWPLKSLREAAKAGILSDVRLFPILERAYREVGGRNARAEFMIYELPAYCGPSFLDYLVHCVSLDPTALHALNILSLAGDRRAQPYLVPYVSGNKIIDKQTIQCIVLYGLQGDIAYEALALNYLSASNLSVSQAAFMCLMNMPSQRAQQACVDYLSTLTTSESRRSFAQLMQNRLPKYLQRALILELDRNISHHLESAPDTRTALWSIDSLLCLLLLVIDEPAPELLKYYPSLLNANINDWPWAYKSTFCIAIFRHLLIPHPDHRACFDRMFHPTHPEPKFSLHTKGLIQTPLSDAILDLPQAYLPTTGEEWIRLFGPVIRFAPDCAVTIIKRLHDTLPAEEIAYPLCELVLETFHHTYVVQSNQLFNTKNKLRLTDVMTLFNALLPCMKHHPKGLEYVLTALFTSMQSENSPTQNPKILQALLPFLQYITDKGASELLRSMYLMPQMIATHVQRYFFSPLTHYSQYDSHFKELWTYSGGVWMEICTSDEFIHALPTRYHWDLRKILVIWMQDIEKAEKRLNAPPRRNCHTPIKDSDRETTMAYLTPFKQMLKIGTERLEGRLGTSPRPKPLELRAIYIKPDHDHVKISSGIARIIVAVWIILLMKIYKHLSLYEPKMPFLSRINRRLERVIKQGREKVQSRKDAKP